jgi:hypothetical protein
MGSKPIGISASRASAILGVNKYQSQFEVWQRIMEERKPGFNEARGFILPPEPDNASIRWGNAFENAVISLAECARGCQVGDREEFYSHSLGGLDITCHIDGLYSGGNTDGELHEGKTTSFFAWKDNWGEPGTDLIPIEYAIQVQHQMICTGASEAIVSVLVFPQRVESLEDFGCELHQDDQGNYYLKLGNGDIQTPYSFSKVFAGLGYFHQYPIQANKKLQKKLIDLYAKWWQDYVISETPPLEGASYEDIRRLCPRPNGTIVCGEEVARWFKKYKKASAIEKKMADKKKSIKTALIQHMNNQESVKEDSSTGKWLFLDETGEKLGQFDGKTFRAQL